MNKTELLAALNKRYAVKKFNHDASKDVSEIESLVKDILQLTPTSF
jgi:predicted oxidoreductase (fatty acid repression mutant protein)